MCMPCTPRPASFAGGLQERQRHQLVTTIAVVREATSFVAIRRQCDHEIVSRQRVHFGRKPFCSLDAVTPLVYSRKRACTREMKLTQRAVASVKRESLGACRAQIVDIEPSKGSPHCVGVGSPVEVRVRVLLHSPTNSNTYPQSDSQTTAPCTYCAPVQRSVVSDTRIAPLFAPEDIVCIRTDRLIARTRL
jgi:hypothetical protein